MKNITVGVLAFQGDVSEHILALSEAGKNLKLPLSIVSVRTKEELKGLRGLIIPGGESTTMQKLCEREGMWETMKKIPNIFGTCAGAILLARSLKGASDGQKTLRRMDMEADRNAYGRQADSFEQNIETVFGKMHAVFIRAPKLQRLGKNVKVLAKNNGEVVACEEETKGKYYLATCFHPEYTSSLFHEHFLKKVKAWDV
jgi:5'-phosphate synthase pdxT subunit